MHNLGKRAIMPHAGNEGPDQLANSHNLIWTIVARSQNQWLLEKLSAKREDTDATTRMQG